MKIGERIRIRREELGLTLEYVANRLNVNRSTVKRYESGQTQRIPLSTIEKLADILQTSTEYLMGWSSQADAADLPKDDESILILSRVMKHMSSEKKKMLIKIAQAMSDIADEELMK